MYFSKQCRDPNEMLNYVALLLGHCLLKYTFNNFQYKRTNSDFILDFGKLPFSSHLGKYVIKIRKISTIINEIGKIKTTFGLGMTPI